MPLEALTLDSPLHYKGDLLTPDDKKRLAANIHGYDISPDMVRLSLVNMYLHGFTSPHIDEYDTLTSDEKWNELADVILANPPFMSPKGGIKPHKRFSVVATRSEVLFVDYIAEHLTPNGRAAVVVPEGIIFQSGSAYKQLREMLVKNYLVAVISLPAGVFNPYSGVKTSILVLDKRLSKKTDAILFAKIDNDGFNLGAQRRPIDRNDLPAAACNIKAWLESVRNGAAFDVEHVANLNLVAKEKIGESGEWGLGGDRYQSGVVVEHKYDLVELGSLCKPEYGFTASAEDTGNARFIRITDIGPDGFLRKEGKKYITLSSESEPYLLQKGDLLVARTGATYGKTMLFAEDYPAVFASYLIRLRFSEILLVPEYYWAFAQTEKYWEQAQKLVSGGAQPQFNGNALVKVKIPLPPLEVQKEIVAEIEGYQKIIDGARQVVENYQPRIPIHPDWPTVDLGSVAEIKSGYSFDSKDFSRANPIKTVKIANVGVREFVEDDENNLPAAFVTKYPDYVVRSGDLVLALTRSIISTGLKVAEVPDTYDGTLLNQRVASIRAKVDISETRFIYFSLCSESVYRYIEEKARSLMQPNLSVTDLKLLKIQLPPLDTQRTIVAQIETEQRLVNANKELIRLYEDKIKATINRVWGEAE